MAQIGQLIRKLRQENKMTVADLAKQLGVSPPTITRKEKGEIRVNDAERAILADVFGLSLKEFDKMLGGYQATCAAIPVLNFSPSGQRLDYEKTDVSENNTIIDSTGTDANLRNIFAIVVCNDANAPSIHDGDYLLFSAFNKVDPGDVVFVKFNNGTGAIGRWYEESDRVRVHFDNPAKMPIMAKPSDVLAIYTCIEHRHKPR